MLAKIMEKVEQSSEISSYVQLLTNGVFNKVSFQTTRTLELISAKSSLNTVKTYHCRINPWLHTHNVTAEGHVTLSIDHGHFERGITDVENSYNCDI